jgi:hypothetical protein
MRGVELLRGLPFVKHQDVSCYRTIDPPDRRLSATVENLSKIIDNQRMAVKDPNSRKERHPERGVESIR